MVSKYKQSGAANIDAKFINVGFIPDSKTYESDTTVLTVGGAKAGWIGTFVALIHVLTWLGALFCITLWGNSELSKIPAATDVAKELGFVYALFIGGILIMVLVHASLARKQEPFPATIASVLLLAFVGFENSLGCAYVAYALVLGNSNFYSAAVASQLLVVLGSSMIVAFYVNWSHNGDTPPLGEDKGESQ